MWMVLGWMGCVQAPDPGEIDAPGASTARSMLWLLLVGCSPADPAPLTTTDSARVSDTCPEPAGRSAIRVVGALRDGDQALTPLSVTGDPLARAVVATGPLVWATDDGEVTLDATPGSRVVLLALSGEDTPTVTDVLPYTLAAGLTVARCGDTAWLWQAHDDGHHTLQRQGAVLQLTGALGAPVCAAGALGLRVEGAAQIGDQAVTGPSWWWTDTTSPAGRALPIPETTRPILAAPGGWLLIDDAVPATLRIDPVAGALVPVGPDPWPDGTLLHNAASDDHTWVVSATLPGGSVLGDTVVGADGRVSVVHAVPDTGPAWTIEVPVDRGASVPVFTVSGGVFGWSTGISGEVSAVDPRRDMQVVTSASERPMWLADACGHPALVGVQGAAWAVVDPRWDADCAAPAFGLVPADGASWTAVDEGGAWVDLPTGSMVNGAATVAPRLARVTWTLGSRGFCEG